MRKVSKVLYYALLLAWLTLCTAKAADEYVEGEVLVTFKTNIAINGANAALSKHALRMAEHYDRNSRHTQRVNGLIRQKNRSTAQLIESLKTDPNVETVEPNYIRKVSTTPPNDPNFSKLWGLQNTGQSVNGTAGTSGTDTNFLPAWKLARSSTEEVVIGVVDTGVDITHPDLAANIWLNPSELVGNGIDDDQDGYIDDVHGYDFANNTATITDSGDHGTHVAGTIAAVGKNSIGVIGVDYLAKILPLKVSSDGNSITTSATLAAYNYAISLKQKGINIVALNASFGGGSYSSTEFDAINALGNVGIIFCAAAGNGDAKGNGVNNDTTPLYPASYTNANIISVAALAQNNTLASFSNYGATSVDIAAPGTNIYSTMPVSMANTITSVSVGTTAYATQQLTYSGSTPSAGLTHPIYSCGIGNTGQFPSGVRANIALIQRGTLTFAQKVTNAMSAGAVAAIIYDNITETLGTGWTLGSSGNWIPSVQVTLASGSAILASLPTTGTVINANDPTQAYQYLDGTSMATPHVTGAVAFAALNFPTETMAQRIARILNHKTTVSTLAGKMTTGGRINLLGIVDTDDDTLPDWWETDYFGNLTQSASGDPDSDGFTNLQELLSGSSPSNASSHLAFSSFCPRAYPNENSIELTFPTVEDTTYQIQWSDNLSTWSSLGSTILGTGAPAQVIDNNVVSSSPKRFYRVGLISP